MPTYLAPAEVFVTDGYPQHTYVDPAGGKPEKDLKDALEQANKIVSIVGSSKTGKTTLCDKYFGTVRGADKILITGDSVSNEDVFWQEAYEQVADSADPEYHSLTPGRVVEKLAAVQIPIIIDDFHYIPKPIQTNLCRQIKNAAGKGIRFVILNTPHRGDDPIRNNNDLSGRFFSVDLGFWEIKDLEAIGRNGFNKIGMTFEDVILSSLASEALRSPQLMQTLCLEACRILPANIPHREQHLDESNFNIAKVKAQAVRSYNLKTQLHFLNSGPAERGSKRLVYKFKNGKSGDVYEVLIRVLGLNEPFAQLSLDSVKERVRQLVRGKEEPNIRAALNQIKDLFTDGHPPIEWDDDKKLLSIVDPHFYFYLRCQVPQRP